MIRIDTTSVMSEVFDDEIVIINLKSGNYYSLTQSGSEIWKLIQQGCSLEEMNSRIATSNAVPVSDVAQGVQQFLQALEQENLIVAESMSLQMMNVEYASIADHASNHGGHFTPPTLTKFTDMQELLLLDPIHEVTETGWPHGSAR